MTVSKTASSAAAVDAAKPSRAGRKDPAEAPAEDAVLQLGELSDHLGYALKRAQLKIFEDFLRDEGIAVTGNLERIFARIGVGSWKKRE